MWIFQRYKSNNPSHKVWVYRMNRDNVLDIDKRTLQNMDAGILNIVRFKGQKRNRLVD